MHSLSTYPFPIFFEDWELSQKDITNAWDNKGDIVIGNDVWIGYEAVMMPGVQVGDGAIIAAKSVVVSDVSPYTIVGGNPAKQIRQRFEDEVIRALLEVAWWNWDIQKITRNLEKIVAADIEALRNCE